MPEPIRVAVLGAGVFGRHHLRVLRQNPDARLVAVVDSDAERAGAAGAEFGCEAFRDPADLIGKVDAAVAAVPTTMHAAVACPLLAAGIDVLVEKPIAPSVSAAREIVETAARHGRVLQIGHLERFNPAVTAASRLIGKPLFFEIHRLSTFSPRSLDVDVILDLMIHDLDIVLSMMGRQPEDIRAAGISVLSDKVDIANVRLEFPGGCVANLTASRVSTERVRKLRLFQPRQYISIDYSRQDVLAIEVDQERHIRLLPQNVEKGEPLQFQCAAFLKAVRERGTPLVDGAAGLRALEAAEAIIAKIEEHRAVVARWLVE